MYRTLESTTSLELDITGTGEKPSDMPIDSLSPGIQMLTAELFGLKTVL